MGRINKTLNRIKNLGGPKGFCKKVNQKVRGHFAQRRYGTRSFPNEEQIKAEAETVFPEKIKFSILVPLYNTPETFLREMIESVVNQTYSNWELCLADGSDDEHDYVGRVVAEYIARDCENNTQTRLVCGYGGTITEESSLNDSPSSLTNGLSGSSPNSKSRIVYKKLENNGGISENTNACYAMATGDYIGLFDHDDLLHPSVLFTYMQEICEKHPDFLYCDETTFKGSSIDKMITAHFKPDFSPDNLTTNNYICHFSVFKKSLAESVLDKGRLFRKEFDGSQDHDLILRLTSKAEKIVHVPKLMYYWRSHAGSTAQDISVKSYAIDAARGAVADFLTNKGYENFEITSTRAFETIFKIAYEIKGNPKVSIIIPNKDHKDDLKRCIDSIREKTTWDNYEIIVVENNSTSQGIFDYYDVLEKMSGGEASDYSVNIGEDEFRSHPAIKVIKYEGGFNYSKINNFAFKEVAGEYVILLNNDIEIITPDWIQELLMYAQRPDVACVGAKLLFPDNTIQHAGIVLGLGAHRTAGHSHYGMSNLNYGYMGRLCYAQNVSAVTAACLMVKSEIYRELGGFDEEFTIALNDVDFCMRARKAGYLNVFTPFAEGYHYESASRGSDSKGANAERFAAETALFKERYKAELEAGDPYYNTNFTLDKSDYSLKI